jgi:hypothetical protein
MHRDLLWTAPDSTASRRDLRQYQAPPWSWASLPATCSFYVQQIVQEEVDTSCMEIEETDVLLEGTNPFGVVLSGKLNIKGLLKQAHPYDAECRGEKALDDIREAQGGKETLFDLEQGSGIGNYIPDNLDRRYLSEVWCSQIMTEVRRLSTGTEKQVQARCLALMRMDEGSNVSMRVGVAWIKDFAWFRDCQGSLILYCLKRCGRYRLGKQELLDNSMKQNTVRYNWTPYLDQANGIYAYFMNRSPHDTLQNV